MLEYFNWGGTDLNDELVKLGILTKPISEYTDDDIGTIVLIPYTDSSGKILLKDEKYIEFEVVGVNHHEVINNPNIPTITLMTKNIVRTAAFDAAEPNNPMIDYNWEPQPSRQFAGNNRWLVSNIRQWLNSEGAANEWFESQHEYDEAPTVDKVKAEAAVYADNPGFLAGFSDKIKQHFATIKNKTYLCGEDRMALSKDFEETEDKVFLPSSTEMGQGDDYRPEGMHLAKKFTNNKSKIKEGIVSLYWMRTAIPSSIYSVESIADSGYINWGAAYNSDHGIAPIIVLY